MYFGHIYCRKFNSYFIQRSHLFIQFLGNMSFMKYVCSVFSERNFFEKNKKTFV